MLMGNSIASFFASNHDFASGTKSNYVVALRNFENEAQKPFEDAYLNPEVVSRVLERLLQKFAASTYNKTLMIYKRYAKWLSDPDDLECPKLWRKQKSLKIDWERKLKDKWLSEDEVWRILNEADNPRDPAMVGVAVEGALSAEELLGLRVGDCEATEYGFDITVTRGKTDITNCVPVVLFAPALANYLNHHPEKHVRDSPLWIGHRGRSSFKALGYIGANRAIRRLAERAGIQRRITLHFLRHTKITWTYRRRDIRISDSMACKMFRWKPGSAMPKRYAHVTGADGKDTLLALAGIKEVKRTIEKPSMLTPKQCLRCGESNLFDADYCRKCGMILKVEEAEKMMQKERVMENIFKDLSDPDVHEWIVQQIRKAKEAKSSL